MGIHWGAVHDKELTLWAAEPIVYCKDVQVRYQKPFVRLFLINCISKALENCLVNSLIQILALRKEFVIHQIFSCQDNHNSADFRPEVRPYLKQGY